MIMVLMLIFSKCSPFSLSGKFGLKILLQLPQKIVAIAACRIFCFPKWFEFVFWNSYTRITNTRVHSFILSIIHTFSKELGEGYRTLITHLCPMFYIWRNYLFDSHSKNFPEVTVGNWYFKKICKSMACIFT